MFTHEVWQQLDETVYQIYASNDSATLRSSYLQNIAQCVRYHSAFFDLKGHQRGRSFYYDPISVNFPSKALDEYYAKYADLDYTSWMLGKSDLGFAYRDSDLVPAEVKERSAFYREWMEPLGLSYACCAVIAYEGTAYGTVTLARQKEDDDFSDMDIALLDVTVRHLCLRFHQLYPSGISCNDRRSDMEVFQEQYQLTEREYELCRLFYSGISPAEIARMLHISANTVNRHIANIYRKMGINSRIELMKRMSDFDRLNSQDVRRD